MALKAPIQELEPGDPRRSNNPPSPSGQPSTDDITGKSSLVSSPERMTGTAETPDEYFKLLGKISVTGDQARMSVDVMFPDTAPNTIPEDIR